MEKCEALHWGVELLETAEAAILTTIDGSGFPETRAMLNLRNKKNFSGLQAFFSEQNENYAVYFTTNASSPKLAQIKVNPAVSAFYCRPDEWRGLMLGGIMEIVTDPLIKKAMWQEGWEMYYPGGLECPEYTILRLVPQVAKYYHQMNKFIFELGAVA